MTWLWAKPIDPKETRAAMDALDKMVNPDSAPKSRTAEVTLQCVHSDGKHKIVWDPAKPGRAICPDCEAVYNVTCEKNPAPGK